MKRVKREFISSAVSHYLRKRQFVDSADALAKGKQWNCDAEQMSLRQVMDDHGSIKACVAFSSTVGEPSAFELQYGRYKRFVIESTEPLRSELTSMLYPLLVHTTLELLCGGHTQPARKLLGRHLDQFKGSDSDSRVLELLQKVTCKQEVLDEPLLSAFRENKYPLQLSENTANSLIQFLKRGDNLLLVQMFNAHFDMKISSSKRKKEKKNSDESNDDGNETRLHQEQTASTPPVEDPQKSLEEQVTLATLKRCIQKVRLGPLSAPSVCFYSLCNNHQGLSSVTISPDQKQLCAGFEDSTVVVWSLSPKPLQVQHSDVNISHVHLAGDLPEDITCRQRNASLQASDHESVTLRGHSGSVYSVCYPTNQEFLLSASEDSTVRMWNLASFTNTVCYRGHNYPVWDVHHSSVGPFFASCSADTTTKVWSTERVYPLRSLIGHTSHVNVVRYHPNGTYLATGSGDATVRLWSTQEGSSVRLMQGHRLGVHTLAFSPCGKFLASAGEDRVVRLWDLGCGQTVQELTGHPGVVTSLTFSEDGLLLASGSIDGTLKIWDLSKQKDETHSASGHTTSSPLSSLSTKPASVLYLRFTQKCILTAAGPVTS